MNAPVKTTAKKRKRGSRHELLDFWERITESMEIMELWRQFKSEARDSYGLYSRDVDWSKIEKERGLKKFSTSVWLMFQAILMKLSPARRVLLLIAIVLVLVSQVRGNQADINFAALGGTILFVLLALELADRVTMKRDMEIARDVQYWLLPAQPPDVPGFDLAFAMRPQNTVAGDYYDAIFPVPSEAAGGGPRLLVAIADVAGKSMPAALLMATFQASLHTLVAAAATLEEIAMGVNRYASANSMGGMRFTTGFIAEIDSVTGAARYVNAGHNAPILLRASGAIERLSEGSVPFGISAQTVYPCVSLALAAGDRLVMFTDGVAEAENETGNEYGEEQLIREVKAGARESSQDMVQRIMKDVSRFAGATRQHDDITCFVLRMI